MGRDYGRLLFGVSAFFMALLAGLPLRAAEPAPSGGDGQSHRFMVNTWEMPGLDVPGKATSNLREEEFIGPAHHRFQPRWTARRRFPTTHIYVRPEGELSLGFWNVISEPKSGPTEYLTKTELELGLPHRLQLDIYGITRHQSNTSKTYFDQALEVRYALANWGELPGNPTLYYEWAFKEDKADAWEAKLLLGDQLAPRWHWGTNFVWEQEVGDFRETSLQMTNGLSYTLFDEKLSVGFEDRLGIANDNTSRSTWVEDLRVGPSIQWRPLPRMHVDFVPLFGVTTASKKLELYLVAGWEF